MKKSIQLLSLLLIITLFISSCDPSKKTSKNDNGQIEFTILQTNDVYEIGTLEGGAVGGMARVAQVRQELAAQNPNILSIMAGDFLNPSVIGTLKHEGKRIKGKQMVDVMNVAGIDLVTFGNHEFDLKEEELLARINESKFQWVVSNTYHKKGNKIQPFQQNGKDIPAYWVKEFQDADGTTVKVGFIGICLNSNKPEFVHYDYPADNKFMKFKETYEKIKNKVDIVIGLTHQAIADDKLLAAEFPNIPLIIGGHEHHNMKHKIGNVIITKADANAKTAYIHRFKFNKKGKKVSFTSELKNIDKTVKSEAKTAAAVTKWQNIANKVLRISGIDPDATVVDLAEPIDATEHITRHKPSVIGKIIVESISQACPTAQGAILNTGSIRIDDVLRGRITEYDVVRILPFGGGMLVAEMSGELLLQALHAGVVENVGNGGYFALSNITYDGENRIGEVNGSAIEIERKYKIAVPTFLLSGLESNLSFFKKDSPQIFEITDPKTDAQADIRIAVINFLKNNSIPKAE